MLWNRGGARVGVPAAESSATIDHATTRGTMGHMAGPPTFTVIMGCNGAGKTTWKRANYARLPARHYDLDAVAGGIGDWNNREIQRRALEIAHAEIDRAIAAGQDFGTETTYAGRRGPGMVQQLREQGYRIDGIYIGTETPDINIERVAHRVRTLTGHDIDPERVRERHGRSLENLQRDAAAFDRLVLLDNSTHYEDRRPRPTTQGTLANGRLQEDDEPDTTWCRVWVEKLPRTA